MASSDSGKVKRVVLLALVCAGCAAAPVIALREAPLQEPIAPEPHSPTAVTTPTVPEPEYASAISGAEDRLEVHAQRALRLVELLEAGCDRQVDADNVLHGKRLLLRLAERALLQTRDPGTERRARMLVEMLRSGC